jgi:hypothetical protein
MRREEMVGQRLKTMNLSIPEFLGSISSWHGIAVHATHLKR